MEEISPSGNRYVLNIINDFNRYKTIYFLRGKVEFNKRSNELRSGGGIEHKKSVPYKTKKEEIAKLDRL